MDYEKLSEESLDTIMAAIRRENGKSVSGSAVDLHGMSLNADLAEADHFLSLASVGMQVGLRKSAMNRKHGLIRLISRAVEKIYLRIAQLTSRDIRDFASAVLSVFHVLKGKLEQLFQNDRILDSRLAESERKLQETESRLAELERKIETDYTLLHWTNKPGDAAVQSTDFSELNAARFYHDFEESFRGTEADIQNRLSVYLPRLEKLLGSFADKRFIDLGCGRGEMLVFLREHGAADCVGVDLNPLQLSLCARKGFETVQQDCIAYLRSLQSESVDAISAVQLVEHLPFDSLTVLLAECFRVLRNGGVLLLETPDCRNLITASTWFYVDPSHSRPVHPDVLRFLAEHSGFTGVEILGANPDVDRLKAVSFTGEDGKVLNENIERLNTLLYGSRDYALIGVKP